MTTIPPIEVKLIADVEELKAGLQKAEAQIANLKDGTSRASAGMESFQRGVNRAALALTAAAAAAGFFALKIGKEMVNAAMEDEKAQTLLASRLRNVVGASDDAIASTEEYISKLQLAVGVADDELRPALAKLVGVTKDLTKGQKLLGVALDLSKGAGVSLQAATAALTRAATGNYASLQRMGVVIDEDTKKSKDFSGVLAILQDQFGGAAAAAADTFAGRLQRMQIAFNEMKETIGFALLPVLTQLLGYINDKVLPAISAWVEKNKTELAKSFRNLIVNAVAFFNVMVDLFQFVARNIKVFVTLGAVILSAIAGAKVAAAVSAFIGAIKGLITVYKTLRTVSLAAAAATALTTGGASAIAGAAAFAASLIGITVAMSKFNSEQDSALDKYGELDTTFEGLDITMDNYDVTLEDVTDSTEKVAAETEKALSTLREQIKKTREEIRKLGRDTTERLVDAQEQNTERLLSLLENYNERRESLQVRYDKQLIEAQDRYNESVADAQKSRDKAQQTARKRNAEALIKIAKDYADTEKKLRADLAKDLAKIENDYQTSRAEAIKGAEDRRISIIKQSMDRLRSVFASATAYDVGEAFATKRSPASLLKDLTSKLAAAKTLQENAAMLAGMGYSQVFIEQVVKQGPKAGNALAAALAKATPEQTAQLQALYGEIGEVSATGLDNLAQTLNSGGTLATRELMEAYEQVAKDLEAELNTLYADFQSAVAEANTAFDEALAEAKQSRLESEAEALADLAESLADIQTTFDEALAEAQNTLTKAQTDALTDLNEGLAAAKKDYDKAVLDTQKALEKSIASINEVMLKRLAELRADIAKTVKEMQKLGADTTKISQGAGGESDLSLSLAAMTSQQIKDLAQTRAEQTVGTSVVVNGYDLSDPNATAQTLVNFIRYGQTITVLAGDTSGVALTGIGAAQSGVVRVGQ